MTMDIHSVRLGLATNSSSSHSIVLLPEGRVLEDGMWSPTDIDGSGHGHRHSVPPYGEAEYGWQCFTAASLTARRRYFAAQVYVALQERCGEAIARTVAESWAGAALPDAPPGYDAATVDHQSAVDLPSEWDGRGLESSFALAFRDFLLRDGIAVLGGNDNDGVHPSFSGVTEIDLGLPMDRQEHRLVCRHDPEGDYWTLFDRKSGAKFRVSFREPHSRPAPRPTRAYAPELCDVKITDACQKGCRYCYQGSTPVGKHAPMRRVSALARALAECRCFEVALGGGEPFEHPEFLGILDTFYIQGIVPSFSTRRLDWLADKELVTKVIDKAGAFAYSVDSADEVLAFGKATEGAGLATPSYDARLAINVQHVLGTAPREEFRKILCAAHEIGVRLTLLAYKPLGRGRTFAPHEHSSWLLDVLEARGEYKCPYLAIDTPLAARYRRELEGAGIRREFYDTEDGAFSMYVDLVGMEAGPSSYCEPGERVPIEEGDWQKGTEWDGDWVTSTFKKVRKESM